MRLFTRTRDDLKQRSTTYNRYPVMGYCLDLYDLGNEPECDCGAISVKDMSQNNGHHHHQEWIRIRIRVRVRNRTSFTL